MNDRGAVMMKKTLIILLLCIVVLTLRLPAQGIKPLQWGPVANNVQIGLCIEDNLTKIMTNQPFKLIAWVKNNSTNGSFCFYLPASRVNGTPILFTTMSPSGKDVSPIPPRIELGSGMNVIVPVAGVYHYEVDSSWFCPFDEIGTYKILAKMPVDASTNEPDWATSNPLFLTVVPGFWKNTKSPFSDSLP
jgi:hypothetical protein